MKKTLSVFEGHRGQDPEEFSKGHTKGEDCPCQPRVYEVRGRWYVHHNAVAP